MARACSGRSFRPSPHIRLLNEGGEAMPATYYGNRRGGHCPGHVRDTFLAALDAYSAWESGEAAITSTQAQVPNSRALTQDHRGAFMRAGMARIGPPAPSKFGSGNFAEKLAALSCGRAQGMPPSEEVICDLDPPFWVRCKTVPALCRAQKRPLTSLARAVQSRSGDRRR